MGRAIVFVYGLISYAVFLASFLYAIGFVRNLLVPTTIDAEATMSFGSALLINLLLLSAFAIQHTIMAREGFKKAWTRIISPAAERSTFVLLASSILLLIFWKWQPIAGIIWSVENSTGVAVLNALNWMGWLTVLLSTFMIDHFDLFGLKQVTMHLLKKEYPGPKFHDPSFYKVIRHPIYFGFILAFWATPTMSTGHLVFAAGTTGYILMGVWFEERDLVRMFGQRYIEYARRVPMLIPFVKFRKSDKVMPEPQAADSSSK